MATATRKWKTETVTIRTENGSPKKRIRVPYDVPDAANREEALAADGLPESGDPLAENSPYRVVDINANCTEGPTFWTVTVDYAVSSLIWFDEDPLNAPAIYQWGRAMRTVTMDRDRNNRPVRNPAGDVPNPPPTQEVEIETLRITQW